MPSSVKNIAFVKLRLALLLPLPLAFLQLGAAQNSQFSCVDYNSLLPINVLQYSGIWYEVVRIPSSTAGLCVELLAPNETINGQYTIEFDYVDNFTNRKELVPVHKVITYPWDEQTQAGIFESQYDVVNITFKVLMLPFTDMTAVCGYANVPGSTPLFKLFARQKELDANVKQQIQQLADEYGVSEYITWVEQSDCSGAFSQRQLQVFNSVIIIVGWIFGIHKTFNRFFMC